MNLFEAWFSIIERQPNHRGTFGSVKELNAKIRRFIDGWNDRCPPLRRNQNRWPDPHQGQPTINFRSTALDWYGK